jgi:hypothetical protein
VAKPLRDTVYQEVQVHRSQCLRCKRTFRVYPEGTTHAQTGASGEKAGGDALPAGLELWSRLLSARRAWGVSVQESGDDAVQEAAKRVPGLTRDQVFAGRENAGP